MIFKKTIFTGFAPNLRFADVLISLKFLCLPWNWPKIISGNYPQKVEEKLRNYFQSKYCFSFDSGRSALHLALRALDVQAGDEVLVQGYTCVVVSNAINWTGARPIYVDVQNDFNMNAEDLEKKITARSKVLIIQHTFGASANIDKLLTIAKKYNLKIIEDCAHSLGTRYQGKLTGTWGDIGMFSFGSDKIISCVRGGALITDKQEIGLKLKTIQNNLPQSPLGRVLQHLFHYPAFWKGKIFYSIFLGKLILYVFKKLNIINKIIYKPEKRGEPDIFYPAQLPNSLANILFEQLKDLEINLAHRKKIAQIYNQKINNRYIELPWIDHKIDLQNSVCLRYPLLTNHFRELKIYLKKKNIILGDWYRPNIAPADIDFSQTKYQKGTCPVAENLSARSANLPVNINISLKDAHRIIKAINFFKP